MKVRALTPILLDRRYEIGEEFDAGASAPALIDGGHAEKVAEAKPQPAKKKATRKKGKG